MTLVEDNSATTISNAIQNLSEETQLLNFEEKVSRMEDIMICPPMSPNECSSSDMMSSSETPTGKFLLEQVVGKLERQDSCMSVGSLEGSTSSVSDDCHEESSSTSSLSDDSHESSSNLSDDGNDSLKDDSSLDRCERSSSVVSDASEEGGRDSGIEAEREPDMTQPDSSLVEKIVTQVEFYFSDSNVVKDKFLLKHIRRNKEGYVSLKLVSSFKKVKQLTKDWRVVAFSLDKGSSLIQINDQRTKIRRVNALPEIDDSPITCSVLALELPIEKPSVESVSQLFSSVGDIAFIRVLRSGGTLPPDVKSLLTKYPVLGERHCAWIEFETPESAKAATDLSEEDGMKVVLIVPESQKKQEKINQQKQQASSRKNSANKSPQNGKSIYVKYANSNSSRKNSYNTNYNNFYNKSRKDSFSNEQPEPQLRRQMQRRKAVSMPAAQNPFMTDPSVPRYEVRRPKSKSCTEFPTSSSPPPSWVQRHLLAAAAASAASAIAPTGSRTSSGRLSRVSVGSLPLSEGIVRFPKGPDGSKGFFNRDIRLRQINEALTS